MKSSGRVVGRIAKADNAIGQNKLIENVPMPYNFGKFKDKDCMDKSWMRTVDLDGCRFAVTCYMSERSKKISLYIGKSLQDIVLHVLHKTILNSLLTPSEKAEILYNIIKERTKTPDGYSVKMIFKKKDGVAGIVENGEYRE